MCSKHESWAAHVRQKLCTKRRRIISIAASGQWFWPRVKFSNSWLFFFGDKISSLKDRLGKEKRGELMILLPLAKATKIKARSKGLIFERKKWKHFTWHLNFKSPPLSWSANVVVACPLRAPLTSVLCRVWARGICFSTFCTFGGFFLSS